MNIQPNMPMSKAAFIEWGAKTEARCELVAGHVIGVPHATRATR